MVKYINNSGGKGVLYSTGLCLALPVTKPIGTFRNLMCKKATEQKFRAEMRVRYEKKKKNNVSSDVHDRCCSPDCGACFSERVCEIV